MKEKLTNVELIFIQILLEGRIKENKEANLSFKKSKDIYDKIDRILDQRSLNCG
jgi:hypothetical protein